MVFVGDEDENVKIVRSILEFLSPHHETIDVFPMSQLFLALKLKVAEHGKQNAVVNIHLAKILMDRNPFSLTSRTACEVRCFVDFIAIV